MYHYLGGWHVTVQKETMAALVTLIFTRRLNEAIQQPHDSTIKTAELQRLSAKCRGKWQFFATLQWGNIGNTWTALQDCCYILLRWACSSETWTWEKIFGCILQEKERKETLLCKRQLTSVSFFCRRYFEERLGMSREVWVLKGSKELVSQLFWKIIAKKSREKLKLWISCNIRLEEPQGDI